MTKRPLLCAALAVALLFAGPALAQFAQAPEIVPHGPIGFAPIPAEPVATPAPAVATTPPGAATQNTVTTTGPVNSNTTISVGTLAGEVLTWAAAAFGSVLATVFTAWGVRLFKLAGVQISDAARDRLQQIILNGLNSAAKEEAQNLAGKAPVEIHNDVVAKAVAYTQAHGADAIKTLGLDPKNGAAVEAIKARIETAIADPTVPTPAILDPAPNPHTQVHA